MPYVFETRARFSWYGLVSMPMLLSLSLSPWHVCRFHSLRQNAQTPPTHASRLARRGDPYTIIPVLLDHLQTTDFPPWPARRM